MSKFLRLTFVVTVVIAMSKTGSAGLVLSGGTAEFTGPGSYTLDVFATAIGQAETIGGYNLTIDFSDPNFTFQSLTYNGQFESNVPVPAGVDSAQLGQTDTNFDGLFIPLGSTASLATVTFDALGAGSAGITPVLFSDPFFGPIDTTVDPSAPGLGLTLTAVPEPSSMIYCGIVSGLMVLKRRRKRSI